MIRRSYDSVFLNRIVNHPTVYPWVCNEIGGPLDLSILVDDPRNILLEAEHGAFLLVASGEGAYEVHTQFLPEGRGTALAQALEAFRWLFTSTDATAVTTMVPEGNEPAQRLAHAAGFEFQSRSGQFLLHGQRVPLDHYRITKDRWEKDRG